MRADAFETGARKLIPAVLIYLRSSDDRVLMIHRLGGAGGKGKAGDYHAGKWNGLGGKLEPDESPWQAARRELGEEAGLALAEEDFKLMGTLQFPNFKPQKSEDWLVFVLVARIDEPASSVALLPCDEGELHWVPSSELLSLNLWPGDRHFLGRVLEERPFFGTIWYKALPGQASEVEKFRVEGL